jgi:hypothetical protein
VDHRQQVGKIDAARIGEADHQDRFRRSRDPARDERVRRIDDRHPLEIDVGQRELRADVVHVVRHPPQDGVGHRLGGIAARRLVAMDLLDPFEIDHRHDADLQIAMLRQIDLVGDDAAMQALVEQHVAVAEFLPLGEGAGCCAIALGFLVVMDVVAGPALAAPAIFLEDAFQDLEFVGFGVEMGEVTALPPFPRRPCLHRLAVEAVECIALDEGRGDLLAGKDLLEGLLDRRGAAPDEPVMDMMGNLADMMDQTLKRPRFPNKGERSLIISGST